MRHVEIVRTLGGYLYDIAFHTDTNNPSSSTLPMDCLYLEKVKG